MSLKRYSLCRIGAERMESFADGGNILKGIKGIGLFILGVFFLSGNAWANFNAETYVFEVLQKLGAPKRTHDLDQPLSKLKTEIEHGKQLIYQGKMQWDDGTFSKPISRFFVCTDCHNVDREDPDLKVSDPVARLRYAEEADLPFLPGTTFYGMVDRSSWFNGDYKEKYDIGDGHENFVEAVQVCSEFCSVGRRLNAYEMKATLAFLFTKGLKVKDLGLTEKQFNRLNEEAADPEKHPALRTWVKSFFLSGSPATFASAPKNPSIGRPEFEGRVENGKVIYQRACLGCHASTHPSGLRLTESKGSMKYLSMRFQKNLNSTYHFIQEGTRHDFGIAYMPRYPLERMSHQQVEDLRAYIERIAEE